VFLVCIALPLLEIAVLVKVGQAIGFWRLLALLMGMAALGFAVLYWQGWNTLRQTQQALQRGEPPVQPMIDGALLIAAGALLLVPGLITDVAALILLLPPVRRSICGRISSQVPGEHRSDDAQTGHTGPSRAGTGPIIDGEFERLDEQPLDSSRRGNQGSP
jgi:UPF0716 protein FxsA